METPVQRTILHALDGKRGGYPCRPRAVKSHLEITMTLAIQPIQNQHYSRVFLAVLVDGCNIYKQRERQEGACLAVVPTSSCSRGENQ
jgi:hypothetical protein